MLYKLVVISDIHHAIDKLQAIIPVINASDYMIFCGDGLRDLMQVSGSILAPMVCVRGNNDVGARNEDMISILLGDTRAIITHGHKQNVRKDFSGVIAAARLKGCNLAFFGHTHRYFNGIVDGVHLICPGALCEGSYAAVVGDGVNFKCKHEYV